MNKIFELAQAQQQYFLDMSGYEPKTTFFLDFTIADGFGAKAVRDTYKRAFDEWKHNAEYITELTMVLNWKIWIYNESKPELAQLYDELWRKTDTWCQKNLKGDDLKYYVRTTD